LVAFCLTILSSTPLKNPEARWYTNVDITCLLAIVRVTMPEAFEEYRQNGNGPKLLEHIAQRFPRMNFYLSQEHKAQVLRAELILATGRDSVISPYLSSNVGSGDGVMVSALARERAGHEEDVVGAARRIIDTLYHFRWEPTSTRDEDIFDF
jgi:hypothetical protein